MFRKLVSNLPFSPALVGQIGFYARRLRKEEATRRLGLFMTALALIVQSLTVFVPSTSANGSNATDMCPGVARSAAGAKRIKECYNNDTRHYRAIMNYFGISKTELWKALDSSGAWRYTSTYGNWHTFGHVSRSVDVKNYSGYVPGELYARKWKNSYQTREWGWKGSSGQTEFMVLADCGNLVLKRLLNPTAKCVSLTASKKDVSVGDTITLTAKGYVDDGAVISKYDFSQDGPGAADAKASVSTSKLSTTWNRILTTAGVYRFTVNIDTTNNKDNLTAKTCTAEVVVKSPEVKTPHVSITKTVGSNNTESLSVTKDNTFTYNIVVKNDGDVDLQNVSVTDTAQPGIQFISADKGTVTIGQYSYVIKTLAVNASVTIKITAKSIAATTGPIVNKACVETPTIPGTNPDACDTASTTTPETPIPPTCETHPELPGCNPNIEIVKTATNNTQGKDATTTKANGGDVISFTITATNTGKGTGSVTIEDNLTDILEYATIFDNGGGTYDSNTKVLSWANAPLEAGSKTVRTFAVKIINPVPSMAQNHGTPESYDCVITNVVRKDGEGMVSVPVSCPAPKEIVEQTVKELPATGPGENMLFAGALLAVVSFFWARSRQLGKEIRLVRKDFSASTI